MTKIIKEKDIKVTFDVNGIEQYIDVHILCIEHDDGSIVLGCQYGNQDMTYISTSIKNPIIIKNYKNK